MVSRQNVVRGDDLKVGPTECIQRPWPDGLRLFWRTKEQMTVTVVIANGLFGPFQERDTQGYGSESYVAQADWAAKRVSACLSALPYCVFF